MDGKHYAHWRGWLSRACASWPSSCGHEISPPISTSSTSIAISLSNLHQPMACQSKSHKLDIIHRPWRVLWLWKDQPKLVINLLNIMMGGHMGGFRDTSTPILRLHNWFGAVICQVKLYKFLPLFSKWQVYYFQSAILPSQLSSGLAEAIIPSKLELVQS